MNHHSIAEVENNFKNHLAEQGLILIGKLIADGQLHRTRAEGDKPSRKNVAYVIHADGKPAGWFLHYPSGTTGHWSLSGQHEPMSAVMRQQLKEARQQRQIEQQQRHDDAVNKARHTWSNAKTVTAQNQHPYLIKKRIQPHGLRAFNGALVVPIYDIDKRLVNLQFIQPDGTKRFMSGGRKKSCFSVIGKLENSNIIQICEGFATGASLFEETGHFTIVALDAGNLEPVATTIRKLYPSSQIIICGDNDESGVGQKAARAAALAVGGKYLIPPTVGDDWNDVLSKESV